MAVVKIGNIEFEVPDDVASTVERATAPQEKLSRDEILREIETYRKRIVELQKALTKEERERGERELRERERKYGYKAGKNAHLIKPKEYRDVPEDEFADPVGFNYPVNTKKRARAALAYFIRFHDAYDDVNAKIFIYERILRALKRFGIKRHFNPDWPGDWLVSKELKEWMEGYDKCEKEDTKEKREEMKRKWARMSKAIEWVEKQLQAGTSHILTIAPQGKIDEGVPESELPAALTEGMDALLSQIAEAAVKMLGDFMKEIVERTRELFEEKVQKVSETIAEALGGLAEALRDLIKEVKGEAVEEEGEGKVEEGEELPPVEGEAAGTVAPVAPPVGAPPAPPTPPAEAQPPAETQPPTAALAKQLGAFITDELLARYMKDARAEVETPYIRATEEFLDALKNAELGRAIQFINQMLIRRYDVGVNDKGELTLTEAKESEKGESK